MARHVLLVTYYFPPAGGPGVQRALNFAKYLPQNDWRCMVLTVRPEAASYPSRDASLGEEVPSSVQVERTGAWDPYALYARLRGQQREDVVTVSAAADEARSWKEALAQWVRANIFLPDARVGWVPFALSRALRLTEASDISAVITTGPPHSSHLVGLALSKWRGIPWIADFRDPWTDIDYYEALPMTPPARRLDAALERLVLRSATRVVTVARTCRDQLHRRFPRRYHIIENGFDPEAFSGVEPRPSDHFVIGYVGNMNEARNPVALWRALARLDARRIMPELRVRLTGSIHPSILEEARSYGLGEVVELGGYVPHDEAVRRMASSALLLLAINRMSAPEGIVTGKLYEYLASGRPVLGIGPPNGDAARLLERVEGGRMCDYGAVDEVAAVVEEHYRAWRSGKPRPGAAPEAVRPYSRRAQTEELARLLSSVVPPR